MTERSAQSTSTMRQAGDDTDDARALIERCVHGDPAASREFQELYGELVYGYPMRVYRVPADQAGDFYVFAFDGGRLYRRLRRYEGRAPLRAYLLGFVLDDLVLEWKRGDRRLETVSMEDVGEMSASETGTAGESGIGSGSGHVPPASLDSVLAEVDTAKAVVFKLLHAEDCELSTVEIRHIAAASGKSVAAALDAVDALRGRIREREAAARAIDENLDSVQAWIQLYERRVARLGADLADVPPRSTRAEKLREEKAELERKLVKRRRQRVKLADQVRRRKTTAPYKEIAAVLATTVGNVGSQVARLREHLAGRLGEFAFGEMTAKEEAHDECRSNPV
jgi:DNA-directed RNA polymerase specialized sigma24 family protein